ncbi:MAG: hypothetical protein CMJ18_10945, partial [Phycisphaeraceae bacterium]|nr:hypothetical protein [Phycisphaeraceae bacterium]
MSARDESQAEQPWSPWITEGPRDAEPALKVGRRWQLLVDTHLLADWQNVIRRQEPVVKFDGNPIIRPDLPWEQRHTYGGFPTGAIYDAQDGQFRIWYHHTLVTGGKVTGIAQSHDGLTWTKPDLDLVEVAGQRRNNVCRLEPMGVPVWQDISIVQNLPADRSPEKRLLAVGITPFASDGQRINGWRSAGYSADGHIWHLMPGGERAGAGGGNLACIWDDDLEQYVLFQRQLTECAGAGFGRYIVRQTSTDLRDWSPRVTVLNPMDPRWPEVESMMAFRHAGLYFGLPQMLENRHRRELEVHLAISRDGIHWEHPFPDQAFIPRGPEGSFDDMTTWFAQTVVRPDRIHFFYAGGRLRHGDRARTADDGL